LPEADTLRRDLTLLVPLASRSRSSSRTAWARNPRARAFCIFHELGGVFMGDALLSNLVGRLHQPRGHDGTNVFALTRDLLSRALAPEETSYVKAGRCGSTCTRAHLTARRARVSALTRGRACCPHAPARLRTRPQPPRLRGTHPGHGHGVAISRERRLRRRRGPPRLLPLPPSSSTLCGRRMRAALCATMVTSRMSGASRRRDPHPLSPTSPFAL
jgi:hypothetical protein